MTKILPKDLTSYDVLKSVAVLLMVVDHLGYHFYPEEMWFRVPGRLCVPMWFFLIGYARTTELAPRLWIGAGLVTASALVAGQYLLPLNILVTIIVARYIRHGMVGHALGNPAALRGMFLILLFSSLPLGMLFEYGTSVMMFVLLGYILRNREDVTERIGMQYIRLFAFASFFVFFLMQGMTLPSATPLQAVLLLCGIVGVGGWLWRFRSETYPGMTQKLPRPAVWSLKFLGRRTLEIYVAHLILFRGIAMILEPERFPFLAWKIMPAPMLDMLMM